MNQYIANLPREIGQEILKFVIPDQNTIEFRMDLSYTNKHPVAYRNGRLVINKKNSHICLVKRQNRRPRYYLSKRIVEENSCDDCWGGEDYCGNSKCCGGMVYEEPYFKSKYMGANLGKALLELELEDIQI